MRTQVLPVPLTGPVYFVSYGGAKFPEAVIVLQGDGVTVDLHGETFISQKGVTSATFRNTPDVPFESIEVTIPQGPFSEFGANLPAKDKYSFCRLRAVGRLQYPGRAERPGNSPGNPDHCHRLRQDEDADPRAEARRCVEGVPQEEGREARQL